MPDIEGFDFVVVDVRKTLDNLRWKENMKVVNAFGEEVWLKPLILEGKRIGITDCCFASSPCLRHSAQQCVQRTADTWRKLLNFVGRVAGSLRRR